VPDAKSLDLDRVWEEEWQRNLLNTAIERVKRRVSDRQFQMFDLCVSKEWPVSEVRRLLHVNAAQVYLAKHRVSALIKKEIRKQQKEYRASGKPKENWKMRRRDACDQAKILAKKDIDTQAILQPSDKALTQDWVDKLVELLSTKHLHTFAVERIQGIWIYDVAPREQQELAYRTLLIPRRFAMNLQNYFNKSLSNKETQYELVRLQERSFGSGHDLGVVERDEEALATAFVGGRSRVRCSC